MNLFDAFFRLEMTRGFRLKLLELGDSNFGQVAFTGNVYTLSLDSRIRTALVELDMQPYPAETMGISEFMHMVEVWSI
jgi:hypothetical protein